VSRAIEHVFAIIGCVTVAIGAITGLLVALGIIELEGTFRRHDDDE